MDSPLAFCASSKYEKAMPCSGDSDAGIADDRAMLAVMTF
jgi:hypothetical protein